MKKIFTSLASVACVVTAFAAQPMTESQAISPAARQNAAQQTTTINNVTTVDNRLKVMGVKPTVLKDGESVYVNGYGPYSTTFSIGLSPALSGYNMPFSFSPARGTLDFYNLTAGSVGQVWNYTVNEAEEASSSTDEILQLPVIPTYNYSGISLTASTGSYTGQWDYTPVYIFCAGSNYFWGFNSECGMTTYPCGGGGTTVPYMNYNVTGAEGFAANGLINEWSELFAEINEVEEDQITDVKFNNFGEYIPVQASPYVFSKIWLWANGSVTEDTELYVNIYSTTDDGYLDMSKPIAKGTAVVTAGAFPKCIEYEVLPVDEDGDEVDEALVINTGIYIAFEGITENSAIAQFQPVYGGGTTFPVGIRRSNAFADNAYIDITYKVAGEEVKYFSTCPYNYYKDETYTTLYGPCNYYLMMDMTFPFVVDPANEENTSNYYVVEMPAEGGDVSLNLYSLYAIPNLLNEGYLEAEVEGDWFDVEITDFNSETFETTFTFTAPASTDAHNGFVYVTGYGMDFTIELVQNTVSGIQNVAAEANGATEYFDIQGRKLNAAPATGFFIQRQGDKVTKVIR